VFFVKVETITMGKNALIYFGRQFKPVNSKTAALESKVA